MKNLRRTPLQKKLNELFRLHSRGCYQYDEQFYDDVEELEGVPFEKSGKFKRVCLYPYFGDRVFYMSWIYLEVAYKKLLEGKVDFFNWIKKDIDLARTKQGKYKKYGYNKFGEYIGWTNR